MLLRNSWEVLVGRKLISDSGNEIGPFRAIEESTLAQLTPTANRGDIYAWYSLIGTAGTAFGLMTAGWILNYMIIDLHWGAIESYRIVFWAYAGFGFLKLCLTLALSRAVELEKKIVPVRDPESAPLLGDGAEEVEPKKGNWLFSKLPAFSTESRAIVINLCILFALDAFASGLAPG